MTVHFAGEIGKGGRGRISEREMTLRGRVLNCEKAGANFLFLARFRAGDDENEEERSPGSEVLARIEFPISKRIRKKTSRVYFSSDCTYISSTNIMTRHFLTPRMLFKIREYLAGIFGSSSGPVRPRF